MEPTRAPGNCDGRPTVVKLGGSLITEVQDGKPSLRSGLLDRLCLELAGNDPLIVVHGTGAFGKPAAAQFGYMNRRLEIERGDVMSRVSVALHTLELGVMAALQRAALRPVRVPVTEWWGPHRDAVLDLLRTLLNRGHTPLIGGGFALVEDGWGVVSSDDICVELAEKGLVSRAVFGVNVPGLLDLRGDQPTLIETFNAGTDDDQLVFADNTDDCTGGMKEKVHAAVRTACAGVSTRLVDGRLEGNIAGALTGGPCRGTLVRAER